jgi:hypothetical protein
MGEDILSVAFLALFAIIVSCVLITMMPTVAVMPTFALIAVCLWVAYDYMTRKRMELEKQTEKKPKKKIDDLDEKITHLTSEMEVEMTPIGDATTHDEPNEPSAKHKNEYDIALYTDKLDYKQIFKESGCPGDTKIANRMKYMGVQDKLAANIRTKWNVEKFRPYLEEELRAGEARDWWDTEADYLDELM